MSQYVECKTEFRDPDALVEALIAIGFKAYQIERHEESQPLYGYRGDIRKQRAHIVIRRQSVGPAANDVGWHIDKDGITEVISEYDRKNRFREETRTKLRDEYAASTVTKLQTRLGRRVQRKCTENGNIQLEVSGYR
jgi:hypothetical protein